ncbi:hypothetical protein DM01DRAFT_1325649 [Hesseltinella vesiculosa]|uniref:GST N-terminal domain-containing protein n=1 Tax=Hesseltinella vesiculosa TaxID=101127 RepID=A0A1X2GC29_9FUNG|nr:hypothetical protein DM01DRAFT_1325649 [Hesseltinella vesiculosa]
MTNQPTIILHWYPQSPFANKIAWILNYKQVPYKTVYIDMAEPRPQRRPLDGGYRKTPILQIGNHAYCDTKAIVAELEERFPTPSLYPATRSGFPSKGMAQGLCWFVDTNTFPAITTQPDITMLPEAFLKDRRQIVDTFDPVMHPLMKPFRAVELHAQFTRLADGMPPSAPDGTASWVLDTELPTEADFSLAMVTMFAKAMMPGYIEEKFPVLDAHFAQIAVAGKHPLTATLPTLTADEALAVAKQEQYPLEPSMQNDQTVFTLGQQVTVAPTDYARIPVVGELVQLTDKRVTLKRQDDQVGTVYTHFPLVAFVIQPVEK